MNTKQYYLELTDKEKEDAKNFHNAVVAAVDKFAATYGYMPSCVYMREDQIIDGFVIPAKVAPQPPYHIMLGPYVIARTPKIFIGVRNGKRNHKS